MFKRIAKFMSGVQLMFCIAAFGAIMSQLSGLSTFFLMGTADFSEAVDMVSSVNEKTIVYFAFAFKSLSMASFPVLIIAAILTPAYGYERSVNANLFRVLGGTLLITTWICFFADDITFVSLILAAGYTWLSVAMLGVGVKKKLSIKHDSDGIRASIVDK
ncbi:hypothetical protein [Sulfitobacter sp. R18_1]|uniref:hypothetical protein n=1 Tax=Sulfitobacter sp. R18_1 TaxID=2821104 RepID=UPI001ADBFEAC|nr:hypothetical protein [Sulfitobacter sp. R18_1]MBO9427980.1 hypothetical protein [Sulfitobacter sp. R18_1]